jgi:hypothetical protein
MAAALIASALWALMLLVAGPAHAQSCMETGAGLPYYRGSWAALSYQDRMARCQEAERRQQERQDRQDRAADRDATRERSSSAPADKPSAESRQQECMVNAAACDTGAGTTSSGGGSGDESSSSRRRR